MPIPRKLAMITGSWSKGHRTDRRMHIHIIMIKHRQSSQSNSESIIWIWTTTRATKNYNWADKKRASTIISRMHHKIIINTRKSHLYGSRTQYPASKAVSLDFKHRTNTTPILNIASTGHPAAPRAAQHWRRRAQAFHLHRARTSALASGITSNPWLPFSRATQAWVLPHKAATPGIIALTNRWGPATPIARIILMPWRTKGKVPLCLSALNRCWTQ